jgi:hypothetical protein
MGHAATSSARGRVVTLPVRAPQRVEHPAVPSVAEPAAAPSARPLPGLGMLSMAPFGAALAMTEACSRMVEQWVDLQVALWQPWIDWQASAAMAWTAPWMLGAADPWMLRGQEQLA